MKQEVKISDSQNKIALNDKQERFCYEYCIDFNATQAAIRAGYSEKTARQIGSKLLTNIDIQNRIKELQEDLSRTSGISALKIVQEHAKIAFSNASKFRDDWMSMKEFKELSEEDKSCIQEVQTKTTKKWVGDVEVEEVYVKVKLYDKQKSLDSLTNILGFNSPIKTDNKNVNLNQQVLIMKTYDKTVNSAD